MTKNSNQGVLPLANGETEREIPPYTPQNCTLLYNIRSARVERSAVNCELVTLHPKSAPHKGVMI